MSECGIQRRCRRCGKRHHQSLYKTTPNRTEKSADVPPDNSGQEITVNNVSRSKSCVLLQTACTYAYTAKEELVPVCVLMDNGSQRSYVSQQLKSWLGSKALRREQLTLNTFGNEHFSK